MEAEKKQRRLSQAMVFLILFGVVSLFSDMTHEGASSIRGAYLTLLGASAGTIGFISGPGGTHWLLHAVRIRQTHRPHQAILAHGDLGLCTGCAGGTRPGPGGRTRLAGSLYAAGDPADGQGDQKAGKGHGDVLLPPPKRGLAKALGFRSCWTRSARFLVRCSSMW